VFGWRWGKMMRKYSTWYRSCSDTKIKKKTYLCKNKIPLAAVLGCIYIYSYWSHVYTDLGDTIGKYWLRERIRKHWLREIMRNIWHMNPMSPMCSYNHGEILGFGWFHEGCLSHGSHVSHESSVIINISNTTHWWSLKHHMDSKRAIAEWIWKRLGVLYEFSHERHAKREGLFACLKVENRKCKKKSWRGNNINYFDHSYRDHISLSIVILDIWSWSERARYPVRDTFALLKSTFN